MISYPGFSECISDGESVEEAIANGHEALSAVIAALNAKGMAIPKPNSGGGGIWKVRRTRSQIHTCAIDRPPPRR